MKVERTKAHVITSTSNLNLLLDRGVQNSIYLELEEIFEHPVG